MSADVNGVGAKDQQLDVNAPQPSTALPGGLAVSHEAPRPAVTNLEGETNLKAPSQGFRIACTSSAARPMVGEGGELGQDSDIVEAACSPLIDAFGGNRDAVRPVREFVSQGRDMLNAIQANVGNQETAPLLLDGRASIPSYGGSGLEAYRSHNAARRVADDVEGDEAKIQQPLLQDESDVHGDDDQVPVGAPASKFRKFKDWLDDRNGTVFGPANTVRSLGWIATKSVAQMAGFAISHMAKAGMSCLGLGLSAAIGGVNIVSGAYEAATQGKTYFAAKKAHRENIAQMHNVDDVDDLKVHNELADVSKLVSRRQQVGKNVARVGVGAVGIGLAVAATTIFFLACASNPVGWAIGAASLTVALGGMAGFAAYKVYRGRSLANRASMWENMTPDKFAAWQSKGTDRAGKDFAMVQEQKLRRRSPAVAMSTLFNRYSTGSDQDRAKVRGFMVSLGVSAADFRAMNDLYRYNIDSDPKIAGRYGMQFTANQLNAIEQLKGKLHIN